MKIGLAIVAAATAVAIFITLRAAYDPSGYYMICATADCKFVPDYTGMALTALCMALEGFLVCFALYPFFRYPMWGRAPLAFLASFLFIFLALVSNHLHAPMYRVWHLDWSMLVTLVLFVLTLFSIVSPLVSASLKADRRAAARRTPN